MMHPTTKRVFSSLYPVSAALMVLFVGGSGMMGCSDGNTATVATRLAVLELAPPTGYADSVVDGLNNKGQVIAHSTSTAGTNGLFLYSNGIGTVIPPITGQPYAEGSAINDSGSIVGFSGDQPFLYTNGQVTTLTLLPGDNAGGGSAINTAGQVIGVSGNSDGSGNSNGFLISSGVAIRIAPLAGDTTATPEGINAAGQIVGVSGGTSTTRGFVYNGSTSVIPLLTGDVTNEGVAINAAGIVVGNGENSGKISHVFVYTPATGALAALPLLAGTTVGTTDNYVSGINASGQIVGYTGNRVHNFDSRNSPVNRGWIYQNGVTTDINSLLPASFTSVWTVSDVRGINDSGQMAVTATRTADKVKHGFLLSLTASKSALKIGASPRHL